MRLLVDGEGGAPFKGRTLPPWGRVYGRRAQIIRYSASNYGRDRARVEEKIQNQLKQ